MWATSSISLRGPNRSASTGQERTQAGTSPFFSSSKHRMHFWILGFALSYSNFGMLNGQETMQKRQPMHLLSRQMTGPSSVLYMARVRQAVEHPAWLQCMHCFLT